MPVVESNAGNTSKAGIMQVMQEKQVMWSLQVIQPVQVIHIINTRYKSKESNASKTSAYVSNFEWYDTLSD